MAEQPPWGLPLAAGPFNLPLGLPFDFELDLQVQFVSLSPRFDPHVGLSFDIPLGLRFDFVLG